MRVVNPEAFADNTDVNTEPFNNYGSYLKAKYGVPAFRVGIDAGFSCPNRKDGRNSAGCTYCDAFGARAMYQRTEGSLSDSVDENLKIDIGHQTEKAVAFLRKRYNAQVLLLYLQAFSGTYGTPDHLRAVYDYALSLQDYSELIVSTRPDCIDQEKAELLSSYKSRGLDVWVELGLQTSNDSTLKRINRGHDTGSFLTAFNLLRQYGIKIAVHLIFGLPGETTADVMETSRFTASLKPEGVKFHNLHIPYNSPLFAEYEEGLVSAPTTEQYLEWVITAIEMMPEESVITRLTCDSREDERAAPKNFIKKTEFYSLLRNEMIKRGSFQGRRYK